MAKLFDKVMFSMIIPGLFWLICSVSPSFSATSPHAERDMAFEGAQWIMFSAAAQAVSGVGARMAAGDDALGALIRRRQSVEERIHEADRAALEAARTGTLGETTGEDRQALEAELSDIEAELTARFPDFAEFAVPRPLSVRETQALLRDGEALLLILSGQNAGFAWAVSREKVAWTRFPLGRAALADKVARLRADLDPSAAARSGAALKRRSEHFGPGFDFATSYEIYNNIISPLKDVLDNSDQLIIAADGPLTSLPFGLLLATPLRETEDMTRDLARADWLIRHHAISVLPAVTNLKSLRGDAGARRPLVRFLGLGDPELGGAVGGDPVLAARGAGGVMQGAMANPEAIRSLPSLPGTRTELTAIKRIFGDAGEILLGTDATETALRSRDLDGIDVLSFATHGLISGDLAGLDEPALVLTPPAQASAADDGLLTASEAATLKLSAEWVILSACNTAAGSGADDDEQTGAEALSGLARAFFLAGAKALMVSHWPVRDDAAARLISDTLARVRADPEMSRATALQQAMLALMEDPRDPSLAHPSAWAPFVVVGDGG